MPDDQVSVQLSAGDRQAFSIPIEKPPAPVHVPVHETHTPKEIIDADALALEHEDLIRSQFARAIQTHPVQSLSPTYRALKRAIDLVITIPIVILIAPLMVAIALAIRLDSPGPAIFRQCRVGQGGRIFRMLKFRSMTSGSGVMSGTIHKSHEDKRITRFGRMLRRTSLDELPQLFNVLRGDMSLVGPRPEIPLVMLERYQPWQYQRLAVPQGITGWWQVTGRGSKLMWQHTEDDIEYIRRASVWFDIRILLKTFKAVVQRDGAF